MEDRKPKKSETSRELIPDDLVTVSESLTSSIVYSCVVSISNYLINISLVLVMDLKNGIPAMNKLAMLRLSNAKTSLTSSLL